MTKQLNEMGRGLALRIIVLLYKQSAAHGRDVCSTQKLFATVTYKAMLDLLVHPYASRLVLRDLESMPPPLHSSFKWCCRTLESRKVHKSITLGTVLSLASCERTCT